VINQVWCRWFYISNLQLLIILPKELPSPQLHLWNKILAACELPSWSNFNPDQDALFLFTPEAIDLLISHFKSRFIWMISCPSYCLAKDGAADILVTPDFANWFSDPAIKKEIWLKWLMIKDA
jgi:hypothetical protein